MFTLYLADGLQYHEIDISNKEQAFFVLINQQKMRINSKK